MAEAIFRDMTIKKRLGGKLEVDSSGALSYNAGKLPHEGARAILDLHGISYRGIMTSKFQGRHFKEFDIIVAMDKDDLADIMKFEDKKAKAQVRLLSDFVKDDWICVPDPWYTGNFDLAYKLTTQGCEKLIEYIIGINFGQL